MHMARDHVRGERGCAAIKARIELGLHLGGRQQHDAQDQKAHQSPPQSLCPTPQHVFYRVMRPIVVINSSTLCCRSLLSPEAKASATQCET